VTPSKTFSTTRQEASNAHHHSVQGAYSLSATKTSSKNMMNHYRLIVVSLARNTLQNKALLWTTRSAASIYPSRTTPYV
jgi:hypothetical protein